MNRDEQDAIQFLFSVVIGVGVMAEICKLFFDLLK